MNNNNIIEPPPPNTIYVNSENQVIDENVCVWVFKCRICSATVARLNDMNDHILSEHDGNKQVLVNGVLEWVYAHKCVVCFNEYLTKTQMEEHVSAVHKINEFHHCGHCSEYFMKSELDQHRLVCKLGAAKQQEFHRVQNLKDQNMNSITQDMSNAITGCAMS